MTDPDKGKESAPRIVRGLFAGSKSTSNQTSFEIVESEDFKKATHGLDSEFELVLHSLQSKVIRSALHSNFDSVDGIYTITSGHTRYYLSWSVINGTILYHSFFWDENDEFVPTRFKFEPVLRSKLPSNDKAENASSAAFNENVPPPCIPEDGKAVPYPGKRKAGGIRDWLRNTYPFRANAEPLTLAWLQHNDPIAHRALYSQSTREDGPPSSFLPTATDTANGFLAAHNIDLDTPEGQAEARRLTNLLLSRLYPRRK